MSSSRKTRVALLLATLLAAALAGRVDAAPEASPYPGIGRTATPAEVKAWDIEVRPDFRGLPKGRGTVAQGQDLWEAKCAGCHGVFGESNEVFMPLIGGTTQDDIRTGHVARLLDPAYPGRTTLMKVSHISTLWDYIHRAMPWTAPKSLSSDEVYAVTAYLLSLADVLPADGELSDQNIAAVQQRLPNRKGKTFAHDLWPGAEFGGTAEPDVQGSACMHDCATETRVASLLPDFARNNNGNLAEQQRLVGPQRGVDTAPQPSAAASAAGAATGAQVAELLTRNACFACHQIDAKLVGPAFRDVAAKYRGQTCDDYIKRIRAGSSGRWGGPVPMPPQTLPQADLEAIAGWLAAGAPH